MSTPAPPPLHEQLRVLWAKRARLQAQLDKVEEGIKHIHDQYEQSLPPDAEIEINEQAVPLWVQAHTTGFTTYAPRRGDVRVGGNRIRVNGEQWALQLNPEGDAYVECGDKRLDIRRWVLCEVVELRL